jgi:hypothetical protein
MSLTASSQPLEGLFFKFIWRGLNRGSIKRALKSRALQDVDSAMREKDKVKSRIAHVVNSRGRSAATVSANSGKL